MVPAEKNILEYLIGNLLINTVYCSQGACIRIESASIAGQLQIRVKISADIIYDSYKTMLEYFTEDLSRAGADISIETIDDAAVTLVLAVSRQAA